MMPRLRNSMAFYLLACLLADVAVGQQSPRFVSAVKNNPTVDISQPTFSDIDTFFEAAFAVGGQNVSLPGYNGSVAQKMTENFISDSLKLPQTDCFRPKDCADVQLCGSKRSGIYRIYPFSIGDGFLVVCDMDTNCGGWTIIQRRIDGSVNFNRTWHEYMAGFGNLRTEFWLGLHRINQLTAQERTVLTVELSEFSGDSVWATYSYFQVSDENNKFRLFVRGFSGPAGDSLHQHNGLMFSTPDSDNDISTNRHCAENYGAGWWFGQCANGNLNGAYAKRYQADTDTFPNIFWFSWRRHQSLQWTEMKIRPYQFRNLCQ